MLKCCLVRRHIRYVISVLLYERECWTVFLHIKKIAVRTKKKWFYRIARIPHPEHMSNEEVIWKVETKTYANQKEIVEVSRTCYEKRWFCEFDTYRIYCRQETQKKASSDLAKELGWMGGSRIEKFSEGNKTYYE